MARIWCKSHVCTGCACYRNFPAVKIHHISCGSLLCAPLQSHRILGALRRNSLRNSGCRGNCHGRTVCAGTLGVIGAYLERISGPRRQSRECLGGAIYPVGGSVKFDIITVCSGNRLPGYGGGAGRGVLRNSSRCRQTRRRLARRKRRNRFRGAVGSSPVHILRPHRISIGCLSLQTVYTFTDRGRGCGHCVDASVKLNIIATGSRHLVKTYGDRGDCRYCLDILRNRRRFVCIKIRKDQHPPSVRHCPFGCVGNHDHVIELVGLQASLAGIAGGTQILLVVDHVFLRTGHIHVCVVPGSSRDRRPARRDGAIVV